MEYIYERNALIFAVVVKTVRIDPERTGHYRNFQWAFRVCFKFAVKRVAVIRHSTSSLATSASEPYWSLTSTLPSLSKRMRFESREMIVRLSR